VSEKWVSIEKQFFRAEIFGSEIKEPHLAWLFYSFLHFEEYNKLKTKKWHPLLPL